MERYQFGTATVHAFPESGMPQFFVSAHSCSAQNAWGDSALLRVQVQLGTDAMRDLYEALRKFYGEAS